MLMKTAMPDSSEWHKEQVTEKPLSYKVARIEVTKG